MIATDVKDIKSDRYYPAPLAMIVSREQARIPVTVLRPKGRINMGNSDQLVEKAREIYDSGERFMLVDLSEVPSLTSAGLRAIQMIYQIFKESTMEGGRDEVKDLNEVSVGSESGSMKLVSTNPEVTQLFTMVGFDKYFEIHSSMEKALSSY